MIKSVLIIVPHQDDDLNVAGCLLDQLGNARIPIDVCFVTNGDYFHAETTRAKEVSKVATKIYRNVYYLGYGDCGYDVPRLYNVEEKDIISSYAGLNKTYGVGVFEDYHHMKYGELASYTKENIKNDLKDVILEVSADLIFCVDYDEHPDHRMVSLLFDECMGEILRFTKYRPLILKKFAYLGNWFGEDDYFYRPMQETKCLSNGMRSKENDCLPYEWKDRLQLKVSPDLYRLRFWKSPLFKLAKLYDSQHVVMHYSKMINVDAVYWYRNTKNLALKACVTASSGTPEYINDFKICDSDNILNIPQSGGCNKFSKCAWVPDSNDSEKLIKIQFKERIDISAIRIIQNFNEVGHISKCKLRFSDGSENIISLPENDWFLYDVNDKKNISWLTIQILDYTGAEAGIREVEVFDEDYNFPLEITPFSFYKNIQDKKFHKYSFFELLYNGYIIFLHRIPNKIKRTLKHGI